MKVLFRSIFAFILIAGLAITPLTILQSGGTASAATVSELNRQKALLDQQIKQAKLQAEAQKRLAEQAANRAQAVQDQIKYLGTVIQTTASEISDTRSSIEENNQKLAEKESELRKTMDQQDALLRYVYMLAVSKPDQLRLFSDQAVSDRQVEEAQQQAAMSTLASLRSKTLTEQVAITQTRDELNDKKARLEQKTVQQLDQKVSLASAEQEARNTQESAEAKKARAEQTIREAQIKESKIEQEISAALTAAIRANSRGKLVTGNHVGKRVTKGEVVGHLGSTGNSTGPHVHLEVRLNGVAVNPRRYLGGILMWPVANYQTTQEFGYTSYAAGGAYGGNIHTGIDLAGPYGQAVYAPADGTVILNQWYGGYGNAWAEQLDNGLVVLLGHMTGR